MNNWEVIIAVMMAIVWSSTILLILYLYYRMKLEDAERIKLEIKLKDQEIEKDVANSSLDDLVSRVNNEDSSS